MSELRMAIYLGRPEPTVENPEPREQGKVLHMNGDGSFSVDEGGEPFDVSNESGDVVRRGSLVWISPASERKPGEPEWQIVVAEA